MRVLFLQHTITWLDENNFLLANAFLARGDEVFFGVLNSLATHNYRVYADIAACSTPVELFGSVNQPLHHLCAEEFDLIWVWDTPHPKVAQDVWQILWLLSKRVPFVNSIEAMMFVNSKNTLGYLVPSEHLVENYAANSFDTLWNIYSDHRQQRWIVKPTNSGCGANVFVLNPNDTNVRALVQSMTGNTSASTDLDGPTILGFQNTYAILQAYAEEVITREKRVVIAGGEVIGCHGRRHADDDHRSNLGQGGTFVESRLTPEEQALCSDLGQRLLENGVAFIGVDVAYPYVIEFNIVNPGGLYDIIKYTGIDHTAKVLDSIIAARVSAR